MTVEQKQRTWKILNKDLSITAALKGARYLEDAVELALEDPDISTMKLYQIIGEAHGKKPASIDRSMRYAIQESYERCQLNHFFHPHVKPTNSEVIFTVADFIRMSK